MKSQSFCHLVRTFFLNLGFGRWWIQVLPDGGDQRYLAKFIPNTGRKWKNFGQRWHMSLAPPGSTSVTHVSKQLIKCQWIRLFVMLRMVSLHKKSKICIHTFINRALTHVQFVFIVTYVFYIHVRV